MPWIKVWLHFVWSTKDRAPLLTDEFRPRVFQHILENARNKNIYIDHINGYREHAHCLTSLGSDQTLQNIMQLIKGESSHWINQQGFLGSRFAWQDEYFVVSVNPGSLNSVRRYIANQEKHHQIRPFDEEFDDFVTRAGFQRFKDSD